MMMMTKKLWSNIQVECKRCNHLFLYNVNLLDQRGIRTRKYCDECKVLQHQDESRQYQRKLKQGMDFVERV